MRQLIPLLLMIGVLTAQGATPVVGDKAPSFSLSTIDGKKVQLADATAKGPVVLVVLRGFPGYQCPYCNRQVREFISNAKAFSDTGATVMLVYPGPRESLAPRASEFMADKTFPGNFELVLDPDYEFTNLYGLRWDAPKETAYPSTFLIDTRGVVFYSMISKSHGGRASAREVLDALRKVKR